MFGRVVRVVSPAGVQARRAARRLARPGAVRLRESCRKNCAAEIDLLQVAMTEEYFWESGRPIENERKTLTKPKSKN